MESRGRGRRGRPRGTPPVFYQQAFVEAMGVAAAAIAQASVAGDQGGLSNLQSFIAHHPPTFTGREDPMVADHWFRQVERILEAMKTTSDATRIRQELRVPCPHCQFWFPSCFLYTVVLPKYLYHRDLLVSQSFHFTS